MNPDGRYLEFIAFCLQPLFMADDMDSPSYAGYSVPAELIVLDRLQLFLPPFLFVVGTIGNLLAVVAVTRCPTSTTPPTGQTPDVAFGSLLLSL